MIPAIVLAAGASTRMGEPKALLRIGGATFVRRILDTLRAAGVPDAVVVVRPGAEGVRGEIASAGFGRAVENPDPGRGQLSSLITGLDVVDDGRIEGALVTLVDVPLIESATVAALLARASATAAPIVRPVYRGRPGHPVVFGRPVFGALRLADPAQGAKPVLRAHAIDEVEVGDPWTVEDVDTPEDYRRLK